MCIAVTGAAHECRTPNDQTTRVLGNNLFTAQAVLSRDDGTLVEMLTCFGDGFFHLRCFRRDDTKIKFREFFRVRRRLQRHGKVVLAGNAQAIAIQPAGVVRAPDQGPYLSYTREMRRVQAADGAATDNANPFHPMPRRTVSLQPMQKHRVTMLAAPASLTYPPDRFLSPLMPGTNYLHY